MILKTIIIVFTPTISGSKNEAKPWNKKSWPNKIGELI